VGREPESGQLSFRIQSPEGFPTWRECSARCRAVRRKLSSSSWAAWRPKSPPPFANRLTIVSTPRRNRDAKSTILTLVIRNGCLRDGVVRDRSFGLRAAKKSESRHLHKRERAVQLREKRRLKRSDEVHEPGRSFPVYGVRGVQHAVRDLG
jgi:hypothetical protein